MLEAWEASGASSPDELRKLLVKRSVQSAGAVLIQTLLDAGAQRAYAAVPSKLHGMISP